LELGVIAQHAPASAWPWFDPGALIVVIITRSYIPVTVYFRGR
jgi:hypothetical protein